MHPDLAAHLPELRAAAHPSLGLYLHIPFCRERCAYCAFTSTRDQGPRPAVLARLRERLQTWGTALERPALDTLYVGGGTPSVLEAGELGALVAATRAAFDLDGLLEATLEANPGTAELGWFQAAHDLGFDRLSLGIQTLDDALLRSLGRIHDAAQGLEALDLAARAGFLRRSADLMLGLPGQRQSRALEDARVLVDRGVEHISIYLLDLDKNCPLQREVAAGRLELPPEDEVADAYESLQEELPRLGLEPYEISNFARPGAESRHNLRYWDRRPYLGLGPSAASHLGRWRWTESPLIPDWAEGRGGTELEELGPAEALAEIPLLGLRRQGGVDWEALRAAAADQGLLPLVNGWERELAPFHRMGLLVRKGPRLCFSTRGMLMSNAVFQVFV
jgi:oxygen-independent coproporphyrinogen III oxidase